VFGRPVAAGDPSHMAHIQMMVPCSRSCQSAISKTVNTAAGDDGRGQSPGLLSVRRWTASGSSRSRSLTATARKTAQARCAPTPDKGKQLESASEGARRNWALAPQ